MIKEIDELLWDWATYVKRRDDGGMGFPRKTLQYDLMRLGGKLYTGQGLRLTPTNDVAEQIEAAITRMPNELTELAKVWYLQHGSYPREQDKAKRMGWSITKLKEQRDILHARVEAYLHGVFDQQKCTWIGQRG